MTKHVQREEARRLRRELGLSINEIARRIGVSGSSVSLWVRDISLSKAHQQKLIEKKEQSTKINQAKAAKVNVERHRKKREQYQQDGRERARLQEGLHLAGCMLYWGEGTKDRNCLKFTNSDSSMMCFFIKFLRGCFQVPDDKVHVRITCYLNNGISLKEIEDYWLDVLELPRTCLRIGQVNNQPVSSKQKGRKLLYGTCEIAVYNTQLVQHIFGAIQEYSGIDNPDWVL